MQGMARGAVGDVVFTHTNGQQVSRVRARTVSQPDTPAQKVQKAIVATSAQAYKAMKRICNKSFEGFKSGSESQARFNSLNMTMIRAGLESGSTRVVQYKSTTPVANPYIIADGSLDPIFANNGRLLELPKAGETLAEWCTRIDLKRSDVFAICMLNAAPYYNDEALVASFGAVPEARQMQTRFGYFQFKISAAALKSDAVALSTNFASIWDVSSVHVRTLMEEGWLNNWDYTVIPQPFLAQDSVLMVGVVRMRSKGRLRSRCVMENYYANTLSGIGYEYLQAAWEKSTTAIEGTSSTILDGSGFDGDQSRTGKKLYQLTSAKWKADAVFYYVLLANAGGGVVSPVIKATYLTTEGRVMHFQLQCVVRNSREILTADEYGNKTWVDLGADALDKAYAAAVYAAGIADNAENTEGWRTQYKASSAYEPEDSLTGGDDIVVDYRSYNKA